jgi:molybdopterin-containing oxidoreductase family iron-sulfur binding subunit
MKQPMPMDLIELSSVEISRRRFLALLGASAALASGLTGCSKIDRGTIVPYTRKPMGVVPGVPNYYASTFQEGFTPYSVLVTTREGRPIHIEGNDEHPVFSGKTSLRAIADILRLYDPDRLRQPMIDGKPADWAEAEAKVAAALKEAKIAGQPVLLLTGPVVSPTQQALIEELQRALRSLVHVAYEPLAPHAERAAAIACFGEALCPRFHFDRADVILSFQKDFLGTDAIAPIALREFAAKRRVHRATDGMNRLWVIEGGMSVTGAKADHRLAMRPSKTAALAFALAHTLNAEHGLALPADITTDSFAGLDLDKLSVEAGLSPALLKALAADLARAGKAALVLAGPNVPVETHTAVHLLNVMLGAEGHTIDASTARAPVEVATPEALRKHVADMQAGRYRAAIFWNVNPAYSYPDASQWASAVAAVPTKICIGLHADETARHCQIILPQHHWLEAWGDYEGSADLLSLQQPTVGPLYDTKQGEEVILGMARALGVAAPADYHSYLKTRWEKEVFPAGSLVPFERFWNAALHDGVLMRPAQPRPARTLRTEAVQTALAKATAAVSDGFELVLNAGSGVYDGRYANNGWLQELPDPVTKVTWMNPVSISPADAEHLHLKDGDVVRVESSGRSVEAPVRVQLGQARGVLSMVLGYGRQTLSVARGVGVNCYPLLDGGSATTGLRPAATVSATGKWVALPLVQTHDSMEGRDLVRSYSLAQFAHRQAEPREHEELPTLYPEQRFSENKWGMAIDLSACVGCGGCMIACQSENNVPVVGPEQVLKGREMHWIRIDRYYEGSPEAPRVVYEPMLCQQCDNAPCENVCPVNATNHSPDGLNQMVYNRCVGTRYCANNCPYKVRRFNFLDFVGSRTQSEQLAFNPEVTVRPRGVMEKCTFCVQRIEDVRLRAKAEGRPIRDREITPACAASCPAEAIVFGDLKNPDSAVAKLSESSRGYRLLEKLGVRPSITYLANITNPAGDGGSHAA